MSASTVTADAQFGIVRLLRPYRQFQADYEGKSSATPMNFSEVLDGQWGDPLDPLAGQDGYARNLVRGLSTPVGSRVVLWLPKIVASIPAGPDVRYSWSIKWRYRNLNDNRLSGQPYHEAKSDPAQADTTIGTGGPRVLIPAASQSIAYSQTPEPVGAAAASTASIRQEDVSVGAANQPLPLIPGGTAGAIQQGVLDPGYWGATVANNDLFQQHEVQALGDELVLGLYRDPTGAATWAFAGADTNLALYLNTSPEFGVKVVVGTAP